MITQTPPNEFLSELADVVDFIPDLLGCPKKAGWHWPSFYLLYVDVDRLSMLLLRLGHMLDYPVTDPTLPSLKAVAEDIHGILEDIAKRQKAIVGMLWLPYRETRPTAAQRAVHDRVGAHIHPKSGWYQTFMRHHGAGEMRDDASVITRKALPTDASLSKEHIDFISAECMLRTQAFDIGTPQARLLLKLVVQAADERLGRVLSLMGKELLAHCRIEDLLHPSSR